MKALVAVKRVMDANVKMSMNPFDGIAVAAAVRLKALEVAEPPRRGAGVKVPEIAASL